MFRQFRALALGVLAAGSCIAPASAVSLTLGTVANTISAYATAFGPIDPMAIGDCLEGLVTEDAAANVMPGQAQSWTISPDGLRYTFTLRPDMAWSNGDPVVAEDFVAGFRWLFDPANALPHAFLYFFIANSAAIFNGTADMDDLGVEALDRRTLQIDLEHKVPYFLQAMMHSSAYPLPSRQIERLGAAWLHPDNIVCNGPFTITEAGSTYTHAVKSARYYDAADIKLDAIDYVVVDDLDAGLARYGDGEIDAFYVLPGEARGWIAANRPGEGRITPFVGLNYYVVNQDKPPFDNPELRRALSMAIDRDKLDPQRMHSLVSAATTIVPPGTANYAGIAAPIPDWAQWPLDRRVETAKATLSENGYGPQSPLHLTIRYSAGASDQYQGTALAVAGMWEAIGVKVQVLGSEAGDHYGALMAGDFDIGRSTWILDFSDPANILDLNRTGSEFNAGGYANPAYDALMQAAADEQDLGKRAAILHDAETLAVSDTAIIPLTWILIQNLVSPRVSGIVENARNTHRSRWISLAGD